MDEGTSGAPPDRHALRSDRAAGFFAVHRLGRIVAPMETVANARVQRYIFSTRATIGVRIVTLEEAGVELLGRFAGTSRSGSLRTATSRAVALRSNCSEPGPGSRPGPCCSPPRPARRCTCRACDGSARAAIVAACDCFNAGGGEPAGAHQAMAQEEARLFEHFISEAPEQWLAVLHPIWPDLEQPPMRGIGDEA